MKRAEVIRKISKAAGVPFESEELTNHTGITGGGIATVDSRSTSDFGRTAETIFKQLEPAPGVGWWRK